MPDVTSSYRDEQRGGVNSIADPAARKEIGKLWSVFEARLGDGAGGKALVTQDDLAALKRTLNSDPAPITQTSTIVSTGGSSSAGSGGINLLPLLNIWTESNVFTKIAAPLGHATVLVSSLSTADGALVSGPGILTYDNYTAALDVRRSTDRSDNVDLVRHGTIIQHRVQGIFTKSPGNQLNTGLTVSMQSSATGSGVFNGAFGIISNVLATGDNTQTAGLLVNLTYSQGGGTAIGNGVQILVTRNSAAGVVCGNIVRIAAGGRRVDAGFVVVPDAFTSAVGATLAFSAGSAYHGILYCDTGLDLSYASCDYAAIKIPANKVISLNGPLNRQGFYYASATDSIQFFGLSGSTVQFPSTGKIIVNQVLSGTDAVLIPPRTGYSWAGTPASLFADASSITLSMGGINVVSVEDDGTFAVGNPGTAATAGALIGYWTVRLGGFLRKLPIYGAASADAAIGGSIVPPPDPLPISIGHAVLYDAVNVGTAAYRYTIEPNQTCNLFASVLAATTYYAPAATVIIAASKENNFIRADATFTVGASSSGRFINFNLYSTSSSNPASNLYGVIGDVHNAGPGNTKAIYGRGIADSGVTGVVVGVVSALTFAAGSTPSNAWAHQFTFLNTATGGNSAIAHFDADVAGNSIPYAILGGSIGNMDISGWFMRWNQRTAATGGFLYFQKAGGTLGFNVDAVGNTIAGGAFAHQGVSRQIPTTGFSITIANNIDTLLLNPAGLLASGTIIMPTSPIDGQEVLVMTSQTITACLFTGTGVTVRGNPGTIAADDSYRWRYNAATSTWFRADRSTASVKVRIVTATGSLALNDSVVFVDATSGSVTLTLPAANGFGSGVGQVLRIKRTDASANTVTVQRAGSDTVDGGTSTTLAALGGATNNAMDFVANGVSAWGIL